MSDAPVGASAPLADVPGAPFHHIAACLDGSDLSERVIPHAVAVAAALGISVTLLRVLEGRPHGDVPPDPLEWEIRRREAREYLEQCATKWHDPLTAIAVELIDGHAAAQICNWARHHQADLLVVSSHGMSGPSEWSLANTPRKLVERAPGSLLLVPAAARPTDGVARYRRILVPMDGSSRAESVLPLACKLVSDAGELILAHVVPVPELTEIGPLDAEAVELRDRLLRRNERVAREYLGRLRARIAAGGAAVRVIVLHSDDVRGRLARLIGDEGVELVVMSAHGRSARCDAPCGSVTSDLLGRAATPMLIVRPAARDARRHHVEATDADVRLPCQAGS